MESQDLISLEIVAPDLLPDMLQQEMSASCPAAGDLSGLRFVQRETRLRSPLEATVLVALISSSSTALVALMTGVFALLRRRQEQRSDVIEICDGERKLLFPEGLLREGKTKELLTVLEQLKDMDRPRINLSDR